MSLLIVTLQPATAATQGDQVYRTLAPSAALAQKPGVYTVCATWLHPAAHPLAEAADVLVLCQSIDADFLPLMARRRAAGRCTIVEINDNFLAPQPHNPVGAFYGDPRNTSLARQLAQQADGLQFSSYGLVDVFGHLNARQAVFENAFVGAACDAVPADAGRKSADGRLRLGWAGSGGHLDDLRWAMPCLQAVLAQMPTVSLHIMAPQALRPLFDWVPQGRLVFYAAANFAAYQAFLTTLDVGLAPLTDTPFNRCRSDVKYLEYAMAGVPGVFSAGPAYGHSVQHERTGLLAGGHQQHFTQAILRLLGAPALGRQLVAAAQEQIRQSRTTAALAEKRLLFWLSDDTWQRPSGPPPPAVAHLPAAARRSPRHWVLPQGRLEAHLYAGLMLGGDVRACDPLRRAAQLAPNFYLPHLYLGHVHPSPVERGRALQRAHALAPQAVMPRFALAQHLYDTKAIAAATALTVDAQGSSPAALRYAPLTELAGRVAAITQGPTAAEIYYLAALSHNRWYRAPALRLAQLYLAHKRPRAARRLLEANLEVDRMSWPSHFLLGELARQDAAWRDARRHYAAARALGAPKAHIAASLAQVHLQARDASAVGAK